MEPTRYCVGIDVSKASLAVCISYREGFGPINIKGTRKAVPNTLSGFDELASWAGQKHKSVRALYVMEATGSYHEQLAWYLKHEGLDVCVLRPDRAKKYMESTAQRGKTDPADAKGLSRMGLERELPLWSPPSGKLYALRGMTRYLEDLNITKTSLTNRLEAVSRGMYPLKEVEKGLNKAVKEIEKLIEGAKTAVLGTCSSDPALKAMSERMAGVPGIGLLTAAVVLAETDGFALFESQKQLTAYAGYDPVPRQSGKMEGKSSISKKGNAHLRRAMFLPSLHAAKKIPAMKALYGRIFEKTGIKMKAGVAVQRKLLCLLYALCKKGEDFELNHKKTSEENGIRPETAATPLSGRLPGAEKKAARHEDGLHKMESITDDREPLFRVAQI